MRNIRIVPCLDVDDGRVVKGVNFVGLRDAGDPVELAKRYNDQGADEIVFLDITASAHDRSTIVELAAHVSEQVFIPFTVGGGIRSVEDAREILRAGAEKVSINSAAVARPQLVSEISAEFGAQCTVVAIDARSNGDGTWNVYVRGGREDTGQDVIEWVRQVTEFGAGEILLTSMDADGTRNGYDLVLTQAVCDATTVPVIASGGAGTIEHLVEAALGCDADALLAASIFHYDDHTVKDAKLALLSAGVSVRPPLDLASP